MASEWISVGERLPESEVDVLTIDERGEMAVASHFPDCTCSTKWHRIMYRPPTHWMPLPEPPQTGGSK